MPRILFFVAMFEKVKKLLENCLFSAVKDLFASVKIKLK